MKIAQIKERICWSILRRDCETKFSTH